MRTKSTMALTALLIVALLMPTSVWAKRVAAGGSLSITQGTLGSSPLTTQLVVTALTANPGLEKTITQQLPLPGPLFVLPFFVNEDKDSPKQGDIDTILMLTNTTGGPLSLTLMLRALDGNILATSGVHLDPFETKVFPLSDLLP